MSDVTPLTPPKTPPHDNYKFQLWRLIFARFHMSYCCESWSWQICWQIYPHPQMHHGMYIMGCIWQPFWNLQEKVGISFYFWIIRQMNLLWLMDLPVPEHRCLAYQYTKLGRWTSFGHDLPVPEQRWLACHYKKLGRWTYFGWWMPHTRAEMTFIPLHKTWQMNLLWLMDPPYQSRDALHTTTHSLADEPTLADAPPSTRAEMPWIPLHKTWQMNLLWPMDPQYQSRDALNTSTQNLADEPTLADAPPVPEQRCIEYQYTKRGRWTYFGQRTPLGTRAEMTWQMNLLLPMASPQYQSRGWLECQYTKLGRWTYFGWCTPLYQEQRCLAYQYTKLGRWTCFGWCTPQYQRHRCLAYQYTKLGRWTYFGQWIPQSNKAEMPFTLLLTSSGQAWQLHIATDI